MKLNMLPTLCKWGYIQFFFQNIIVSCMLYVDFWNLLVTFRLAFLISHFFPFLRFSSLFSFLLLLQSLISPSQPLSLYCVFISCRLFSFFLVFSCLQAKFIYVFPSLFLTPISLPFSHPIFVPRFSPSLLLCYSILFAQLDVAWLTSLCAAMVNPWMFKFI